MKHIQVGNTGEHIAREFCIRKGWDIIHTNWRAGREELDIIAKQNGVTIFIEVKSRTSNMFGYPEEALTPHKQESLRKAIAVYCSKFRITRFRVDVLCVDIRGKKASLRHLQDVELLPKSA